MHPRLTARLLLITFSFFVSHGIANRFLKYCSPPGPHAPYAKGLKNSPLFKKTAKEELDTLLKSIATEADASVQYEMELGGKPIEDTLGGAHISIAITSPTETFYTFNYGAELQVPKTSHPEKVWTEHTIFRVASVSKALTVWEILKLGIDWNERVVDYLPELERGDYAAEWRELTVGALAGYVGGTVRDFEHDISQKPTPLPDKIARRGLSDDHPLLRMMFDNEDGFLEGIWKYYFKGFDPETAYMKGFPPLQEPTTPRCFLNCTREEVLDYLANRPLIYPGFTTPAYSNVGFSLLGMIAERKSGLSFDELMQRDLYGPLVMEDTFHKLPVNWEQKRKGWGAFPFWGALQTWNETREIWGDWGVPAGGMYTSAHDLSKFLRNILQAFPYCTDPACFNLPEPAVPAAKLREWLQPTAFTGGKMLLGRPWEIKRKKYSHIHGERAITLYSKAGGGTGYNLGIVVVPEYGIGLTILTAGDNAVFHHPKTSKMEQYVQYETLAKLIYSNTSLFKTIEKIAYNNMDYDYSGKYSFENLIEPGDIRMQAKKHCMHKFKKNAKTLDSMMQIQLDEGPGLRLTDWTSNGTDFIKVLEELVTKMQRGKREGAVPVARLFPVGWSASATRENGDFVEDWRVWLSWEWENISSRKTPGSGFRWQWHKGITPRPVEQKRPKMKFEEDEWKDYGPFEKVPVQGDRFAYRHREKYMPEVYEGQAQQEYYTTQYGPKAYETVDGEDEEWARRRRRSYIRHLIATHEEYLDVNDRFLDHHDDPSASYYSSSPMDNGGHHCRAQPQQDHHNFKYGSPQLEQNEQHYNTRSRLPLTYIDGEDYEPDEYEADNGWAALPAWPCADYNGIELHAWEGWSLGHVRFIREKAGGAVKSVEVPALRVRLKKE